MEGYMTETKGTVPEIHAHIREKTEPQLMKGHPYIAPLGHELLEGVIVKRWFIEVVSYENLSDAAIAEMAARLREKNIPFFRENPEHPETTVSHFLRNIGLPKFKELNGSCIAIKAPEGSESDDEPDDEPIDVSSGTEPFICSGSRPLIPKRIN